MNLRIYIFIKYKKESSRNSIVNDGRDGRMLNVVPLPHRFLQFLIIKGNKRWFCKLFNL